MYVYDAYLFYTCYSDCVGIYGNVCYVATIWNRHTPEPVS